MKRRLGILDQNLEKAFYEFWLHFPYLVFILSVGRFDCRWSRRCRVAEKKNEFIAARYDIEYRFDTDCLGCAFGRVLPNRFGELLVRIS